VARDDRSKRAQSRCLPTAVTTMPLTNVLSPGALTGLSATGAAGRRPYINAWALEGASCRRPTRDDRLDTRGIAPIRADTRPESGCTDTEDTRQDALQASDSWREARQRGVARIDGPQAWSGLYVKRSPTCVQNSTSGMSGRTTPSQLAEAQSNRDELAAVRFGTPPTVTPVLPSLLHGRF
jgi:hypothetical protein